eukprot:GEMP01006473.1.p1 GENE.GEMP01006473.1~~GEMP01006473.1.p1  ORF type:complete len:125 (-),score=0.15 GEMP01006473.1:3003-3377(-)
MMFIRVFFLTSTPLNMTAFRLGMPQPKTKRHPPRTNNFRHVLWDPAPSHACRSKGFRSQQKRGKINALFFSGRVEKLTSAFNVMKVEGVLLWDAEYVYYYDYICLNYTCILYNVRARISRLEGG